MSKELVYTYIKDIANHLREPGIYGHASVMVGAGFSKNAVSIYGDEQLPDWGELSNNIYKDLYPKPNDAEELKKWDENRIKKTSGKNVIKLAEEYKVIFGQYKLDKLIEMNLSDENYKPGELHKMLLELPWNDVFTTNYDTLLERTIELIKIQNRRNYKIVLSQKDLPGSTRPRIIKLHGSIPNSRPYIISEEDYRTYPKTYAPFVNTVQQSMLETQLCLIGFSGDDPNFTNWLGWLRDNMHENCPKIYLCNIFDNLSKSEKTLLENNNIIVVDLSVLLDLGCENKYEEGIKIFIKEIKKFLENRDNQLDKLKILSQVECGPSVTKEIMQKYYDLIPTLRNQREQLEKYVALPIKIINILKNNLEEQFYKILKYDDKQQEFIIIVYEFLWRMNKCFIHIYDYQAKKLEELLNANPIYEKKNISKKSFVEAWLGINFALGNIYRRYGKDKEFRTVMNRLIENKKLMNTKFIANYFIENSLYYLQNLNYTKTREYLNKISNETSPIIAIKKAFILSQLGLKDDAYDSLKKVSAHIAQMNCTNEEMASLVGYMNLCFRSINIRDKNEWETFSDIDIKDNEYNTRNILNKIKDDLIDKVQNVKGKSLGITKGFNPNSFIYNYGTTPEEIENAEDMSFRYLMFVDVLCLPVYSDHKVAIVESVKIASKYIEDKIWLWSYIVRTEDEKVYDNFFTRPYITYIGNDSSKKLFDRLIDILDIFDKEDIFKFNINKIIISKKCITDLLSRFALVANDEGICEFVKRFIIIIDKDKYSDSHINSVILRLSYFFNKQILTSLIENILSSSYNKFHLSASFENIKVGISEQIFNRYINQIIKKIKDDDINVRDEAISRIVLLSRCNSLYSKKDDIEKAIWLKTDNLGLPKSNLFLPTVWEELPHHKNIDFKILMKKYFSNLELPISKNNGGISFGRGMEAERIIDSYINVFYMSSSIVNRSIFKVGWKSEELYNIIQKIFDYINEEKEILNRDLDIFGEIEFARKRLVRIGELTALIAAECLINNLLSKDINHILNRIVAELEKSEIIDLPLRAIMNCIEKSELSEKIIDELNYSLFSKESEVVRLAFLSLNVILLFKESKILNDEWIDEVLQRLLITMPYVSTKQNSKIFIQFSILLSRESLRSNDYIILISNSLDTAFNNIDRKVKNEYDEIINDIYLLDSLYNLSKFTKKYIEVLTDNNIKIPIKLKKLVNKLMNNKSPEVRNLWLSE